MKTEEEMPLSKRELFLVYQEIAAEREVAVRMLEEIEARASVVIERIVRTHGRGPFALQGRWVTPRKRRHGKYHFNELRPQKV